MPSTPEPYIQENIPVYMALVHSSETLSTIIIFFFVCWHHYFLAAELKLQRQRQFAKLIFIMASQTKSDVVLIENPNSKVIYRKGNFLGKGGFAKCYEFINTTTKEIYAGKVVSKKLLMKPHHKEKMFQEIQIHSSLSHEYIVALHSYFEDDENVYIILELCRKRSLTEMHKRRQTLTLPEVRYFMRQIGLACKYLHDNKVIHRDLKLGNLFINDDMEIKVGDFGLATRVSFEGERKKTLCGTPNYIAPEILTKSGHSFEVDMWSLGCIMYTLLIGTPPFETSTLKNTYNKIKKNEYILPVNLERSASNLIKRLLHPDPSCRPSADEILSDDFLTTDYIPSRIPVSCLSMAPRLSHNMSVCKYETRSAKKPLGEPNIDKIKPIVSVPTNVIEKADFKMPVAAPKDFYLKDLFKITARVVKYNLEAIFTGQPEDAQDPSSVPFVWISKWVDYTDKYGMGYQLCDNSLGVSFNDLTHLILLSDGQKFEYIEGDNRRYCDLENYPPEINKKVTILKYFSTYMYKNLLKAGESAMPRECDEMTQVPHLRTWFRTKAAIVFHLTNGTVQVNFFKDHTKIILCPIMEAVSFIDEERKFTVYSLKLIEQYGCNSILASRLKYAKSMVEKLYAEYYNLN